VIAIPSTRLRPSPNESALKDFRCGERRRRY
jgi:hypothetical protein